MYFANTISVEWIFLKSWPFFAAFEKLIELRCLIPKDMISLHIELLRYLSLEGEGGERQKERKEVEGKEGKKKPLCSLSKAHKARKFSSSRTQGSDPLCHPKEGKGLRCWRWQGCLGLGHLWVGGSEPRVPGNKRPELSGYSGAS